MTKNPTITFTAVSASITALLTFQAHADTITVCQSGCDHTSINAAIAAADDGDVIQLSAEIYTEDVQLPLDRSLEILGDPSGAGTRLQGGRFQRLLDGKIPVTGDLVVEDIGERVNLVVMDLSFISLTKVLPAAFGILEEGGSVISLIKPQFELSRGEVGKGGIVREPELHEKAVEKIKKFVTEDLRREWVGLMTSPITGTDGNVEFLAWMR